MGMKGEVLSLEATFDKFDVLKAFHRYRILNYIYTWLYMIYCTLPTKVTSSPSDSIHLSRGAASHGRCWTLKPSRARIASGSQQTALMKVAGSRTWCICCTVQSPETVQRRHGTVEECSHEASKTWGNIQLSQILTGYNWVISHIVSHNPIINGWTSDSWPYPWCSSQARTPRFVATLRLLAEISAAAGRQQQPPDGASGCLGTAALARALSGGESAPWAGSGNRELGVVPGGNVDVWRKSLMNVQAKLDVQAKSLRKTMKNPTLNISMDSLEDHIQF